MTRWLCAHLPYFRTERITRASQAPDKPLAVVEERGDSVLLVAASAKALAAGVQPGMTATAAKALVPELGLTAVNPAAEAADFESLAAAMNRFTPRVHMDLPRALLLDITGCERLFGDESALAGQAIAMIERLGYRATIGLADNPTAAYALALDATEAASARLGTNEAATMLRSASVAALRLEDSDLEHLDALGVRTVGELLILPFETLPARFSKLLIARLRELRGDAVEDFPAFCPPEILCERLDFTDPTDRYDAMLFALRRIAVALEERLAALGAGALLLEVSLRAHEGAPVTFAISLSRPARDSRSLAALLLGRFESVDRGEQWFEGIEVRVPSTGSIKPPQRDLFGERDPAHEHSFVELIDELTGRLGSEAVVRAELTADPRPERSHTWRPFLQEQAPSTTPQAPRPVAVFEPHEVDVECDAAGRPAHWFDGGRESRLTPIANPERVHFGWWSGDGAPRDYHVVEDESGARWWLMRRENRWYVAGAF